MSIVVFVFFYFGVVCIFYVSLDVRGGWWSKVYAEGFPRMLILGIRGCCV